MNMVGMLNILICFLLPYFFTIWACGTSPIKIILATLCILVAQASVFALSIKYRLNIRFLKSIMVVITAVAIIPVTVSLDLPWAGFPYSVLYIIICLLIPDQVE